MKNYGLLGTIVLGSLIATSANAQAIFNNIPSTLANSYPSLGYEATSTQEFGNRIEFAAGPRLLTSATFTMVNWAKQSDWTSYTDPTGYAHPLTVNIYAAGTGNTPGALLGSKTQSFQIPWRPEVWPTNGFAFNVTFDLSTLGLTAPNQIVYGIAYNTQSHGYNPLGVSGPYNSLNYGVTSAAPTAGLDLDPDDVMWNTSFGGFYTDGGAGGVGVFRRDTDWTGFTPMARFEAVPEPASMIALGLGAASLLRRRKK